MKRTFPAGRPGRRRMNLPGPRPLAPAMRRAARCAWALAGLSLLALSRPAPATDAPPPPRLVAPDDDPGGARCLSLDPEAGVKLDWRRPDMRAAGLATYVEVWRGEATGSSWRPWVKKYANPPFTLAMREMLYNAAFAWRVWTVDRSGVADPYASPSEWWFFCTRPAGRR
jgi:hypothetical protein